MTPNLRVMKIGNPGPTEAAEATTGDEVEVVTVVTADNTIDTLVMEEREQLLFLHIHIVN